MPRLHPSLTSSPTLRARFTIIAVCTMMLISQIPFNDTKATVVLAEGGAKKVAPTRRDATQIPSQAPRNYRDGEVLLRFREDAPKQEIDALLLAQGARLGPPLRGSSRVQ